MNEVVCGALYRQGLLCRQCIEDHGLALYARNWQCVKCSFSLPTAIMWILYLLLEVLPLVLFFLLVVIMDIQAATPPFSAFVLYCQTVSQLLRSSAYVRTLVDHYSNDYLRLLTLSLTDVWNLDFFRHIVPVFCVSSDISNLDSIFLELAGAVFPLLLVVLVYVVIELHARNVIVIVKLWRPFHRCFVSCRRSCSPQASIVNAFVTFIVIGMNKMVTASLYSVYTVTIHLSYPNNTYQNYTRLFVDPLKNSRDVPYLIILVSVILVCFVLVPIVLNIAYPMRCLRKYSCLRGFYHNQTLCYFMDAWQGHFKNHTNSETCCDFRYCGVLFFIHRIFIMLVVSFNVTRLEQFHTPLIYFILAIYLTCMALFHAIARPYTSMRMNVLESLLYGLLAMVLLLTFSLIPVSIRMPHKSHITMYANTLLLFILLPSLVMLMIAARHLLRSFVRYFEKILEQ